MSRGDVQTDDAELYQQLVRLKSLNDQVITISSRGDLYS
jgi:hypothetical protein